MSEPGVFWLSMHVPYACRHSGACCSADWPIPLERAKVAAVRLLRSDATWLLEAPSAPADIAGVLARSGNGRCVFHRDVCEIQHHLGHGALPSACQHFPRRVLIDPRGVFVTLSHYCPTAADLLFDHVGAVEIVGGPPVLPDGDPEGLDARDVLPPLLTEGVLMDWAGYGAWEAHAVRVLSSPDGGTPEDALALLGQHASAVQLWRPGDGSLSEHIALLDRQRASSDGSRPDQFSMVIRRFLAAHVFASWHAYQGNGLSAVLDSLRVTLNVLRQQIAKTTQEGTEPLTRLRLKEAIRQTDLRLVHQMSNTATTGP